MPAKTLEKNKVCTAKMTLKNAWETTVKYGLLC